VAENKTFHTYTSFGNIHDITYRNIQVFAEEGVPAPKIEFISRDPQIILRRFNINNVTWNGTPVPMNFFDITIENAKEIKWEN
jgi:hypothetical protein